VNGQKKDAESSAADSEDPNPRRESFSTVLPGPNGNKPKAITA
jgi:hypothetical protein